MEFVVTKTSGSTEYSEETCETIDLQPCKDAYKKPVDRVEVRTLYREEEFDKRHGTREGLWRSKGEGHGFDKNGYIRRVFPKAEECWVVSIDSLENLMRFIEDNESRVVIFDSSRFDGLPQIEIYNDYRE